MKTFILTAAFALCVAAVPPAGAKPGNRHGLDRISDDTGVPVATLEAQRAATSFGYGELEKANLLANASGSSFDEIVAMRQSGQGWGRIARDLGLNLGKVVSNARRSDQGALHAQTGRGHKGARFEKERGRSKGPKKFDVEGGRGHGHGHGGH